MNSNRASSTLTLLIAFVSLLGLGVLTAAGTNWANQDITLLLALAALAVVSEIFDFSPLPNSAASTSLALILAAGTISGLPGVAVVASAAVLADAVVHRVAFRKAVFNEGSLLLTGAAYVGTLEALSATYSSNDWIAMLGPTLAGAGAAFVINSTLLALAIALESGSGISKVWREHCSWMIPHFAVMSIVALPMAAAFDRWELPGLAIPLVALAMVWLSIKQYTDRAHLAPATTSSS